MPEIITGATAKKEFDEWKLYNNPICDCGNETTRDNVVMVETEKTLLYEDKMTAQFVCSDRCAEKIIDNQI